MPLLQKRWYEFYPYFHSRWRNKYIVNISLSHNLVLEIYINVRPFQQLTV